jgi:hypothetical protein
VNKFKSEIARISKKLAQKREYRENSHSQENRAKFAAMSDDQLRDWGMNYIKANPTPIPPAWDDLSEHQAIEAWNLFAFQGIPMTTAIKRVAACCHP